MTEYARFLRLRSSKKILILSACMLLLSACRPPLADELPRPVGIGRTSGGEFRFVIPLCEGEAVSAFEIEGHQTGLPVWEVSQPTRTEEQNGEIVLGDARGFVKQEVPLKRPLPPTVSVSAWLAGDLLVGSGFLLEKVPQSLAGTDRVLKIGGEILTEEEFRRQVDNDYC
ncbi:hypothetical protein [Streptosporangium sp. NBC_01756]|uniref:hypothetical protein n=1 Tax=Streptosporangium sp. NBC_01756 TaxID=2975950 RepID=UPI002DD9FE85|nr:hypothetical protein [Streptosporangium sp. NBC_01756]WSC87670.1 hypothetical protein OIE48_05515 [Streptosporangium sp. NBC_01756]